MLKRHVFFKSIYTDDISHTNTDTHEHVRIQAVTVVYILLAFSKNQETSYRVLSFDIVKTEIIPLLPI